MANGDVLKSTLEVKVKDDVFEFRIPNIHDEIKVGIRAKDLRRSLDDNWNTFDQGLDGEAMLELRACACMEILLVKSTARWPWTEENGKVQVLSGKFPAENFNDVILAYQGFQEALSTFRDKRVAP